MAAGESEASDADSGGEDVEGPGSGGATATRQPPTERRWQLIARRKRQGYSQEKLAQEIGVSPATIRRWERGGEISPEYRRPLAQALDVSLDRLERILGNEDDENDEPLEKVGPLAPEGLTIYLSMEHSAWLLQAYQPHFIHGLLQTPEYARALVQASDYAGEGGSQVERLVGFRTNKRQEALTRPDDPLELDLVVSEAALHQVVGNRAVMREQLEYLELMTERPNVTVRVLAYTSGPHTAGYGPFAILTFPLEEAVSVVYVNSYLGGSSYLEKRREVDFFTGLFERVSDLSLSPKESVKLIRQIAVEEFS